jgi:dihydrolipoamide dehydrogenase
MPSKLLIAAADAAFGTRKALTFSIEATPSVVCRAVMARVREERDRFVAETLKSIEKLPAGSRKVAYLREFGRRRASGGLKSLGR